MAAPREMFGNLPRGNLPPSWQVFAVFQRAHRNHAIDYADLPARSLQTSLAAIVGIRRSLLQSPGRLCAVQHQRLLIRPGLLRIQQCRRQIPVVNGHFASVRTSEMRLSVESLSPCVLIWVRYTDNRPPAWWRQDTAMWWAKPSTSPATDRRIRLDRVLMPPANSSRLLCQLNKDTASFCI